MIESGGVRATEMFAHVPERDRERAITVLTSIRAQAAAMTDTTPTPPSKRRKQRGGRD